MLRRITLRRRTGVLGTCLVLGALALLGGGSNATASDRIVVSRGGAVQIAVVLPFTGDASVLGQGAWNAVQLAVEKKARIKGFPVQLNSFDGPCGPDGGLNLAAANQVVANPQNVAVIGHFCSNHFMEALPVYEAARVVAISGSATNPNLPSFGPDVFNSVAVSDACCPYQDNFGPWYATVADLPKDLFWRQQGYTRAFAAMPPDFADLYYDATSLLLNAVTATSSLDSAGNLTIDRAALALALRNTVAVDGVTCDISLSSNGFRINDPISLNRCSTAGWQHPRN